MEAEVRLRSVSLTAFVNPEVGPAGVIPAMVALFQVNEVPAVADVAE